MPRWVVGFIVAAVAVAFLAGVVLLIGGGDHGPARHLPGDGDGTTSMPESRAPPVDDR